MTSYSYVTSQARLDELVDELIVAPAYGLDTEFHRENTYYPHLALLQLSGPSGIFLVDPFAVDIAVLSRLFKEGGIAIVHAASQDFEILDRECGAIPHTLFDTQIAAGFLGFRMPSLVLLLRDLLGVTLEKEDRLTVWTDRPLTSGQMEYAAADVASLLDLHQKLIARLEERDRGLWVEEECELFRASRIERRHRNTLWWKLKGARKLRGLSRGVAQTVAAWRDEQAAACNLPVGRVLSDMAIMAIAGKPPRDEAELWKARGVERRRFRQDMVSSLLYSVREGRSLKHAQLRLPPVVTPDRSLDAAAKLGAAWLSQLSVDLEIEQRFLATSDDIFALLSGKADCRLSQGWRQEIVGRSMQQIARGELALACDGSGGLELRECENSFLLRGKDVESAGRVHATGDHRGRWSRADKKASGFD